MTVWKSDTCGCILEYDNNIKFINSYNKCNLHKLLDGQLLLDSALSHNQTINLNFKNIKMKDIFNEQDMQELKTIKQNERNRIKGLG